MFLDHLFCYRENQIGQRARILFRLSRVWLAAEGENLARWVNGSDADVVAT
jgi:hypothetical protein